jgi:hypothetical protein
MTKYRSKAERMFEAKALHAMKNKDWDRLTQVGIQFEAHLRLIEPMCEYELQHTDEVGDIPVCKIHGNNSKHTDESDSHRLCLTIDPYTSIHESVVWDDPPMLAAAVLCNRKCSPGWADESCPVHGVESIVAAEEIKKKKKLATFWPPSSSTR